MKKEKILLGAHISTEGGLHKALIRGKSIGCTTLQIFTKSNRQWKSKPITKEEADLFIKTKKELGIECIIAHASYLLNLASGETETYTKSIKALAEELSRCQLLQIPYLVLHPGARLNTPLEKALENVALGINEILNNDPGETKIILETMAGQGTTVGKNFNEIGSILNKVSQKNKIGVCLDTCHIFAAGYDFRSKEPYKKLWKEFQEKIGLEKLKVIHLNDSKKTLGSCVDRHENIGAGEIGLEGFKLIMNDKQLLSIPKILETPKTQPEDDKRNIKKLLSLLEKSV